MSNFWLSKMKTYFERIDFDKDGAITRRDFEAMAKRFIDTGELKPEQQKDLQDTVTAIWDKYLKAVGGDKDISKDAFIDGMKKLVHDPELKGTLEGPLPLFFHAVDFNNDGLISKEEYAKYFSILGLDANLAEESFHAIDDNGDGQISLEEFIHNGSEFFLEEKDDSKPSKLFWGPLLQ